MTTRIKHPRPKPDEVVRTTQIDPTLPTGRTKGETAIAKRTAKIVLAACADAIDQLHNATAIAFRMGGGFVMPIGFQLAQAKKEPAQLTATFNARSYLAARLAAKDTGFHKKA